MDQQRGRGVFAGSLEALRRLNALGYGLPGSPLGLDLVYNPQGASLPPDQSALEVRYRAELRELFGIEFHRLFTITNVPIQRFAHALAREGREAEYLSLLVSHFNPQTVEGLMCRHLVSVGWDGELYDCDFNQMLELPLGGRRRSVWDVEALAPLEGERGRDRIPLPRLHGGSRLELRRRAGVKLARIALVLLALVALVLAGRTAGAHFAAFAAWVQAQGALGAAGLHRSATRPRWSPSCPARSSRSPRGAIFGVGWGTLYVLVAATLGSALAFLVARYVARGAGRAASSRATPKLAGDRPRDRRRGPQDRAAAAALAGVSRSTC